MILSSAVEMHKFDWPNKRCGSSDLTLGWFNCFASRRVQSFRSITTHRVETLTDIGRRIFPLHCRMFSALLAGSDVRATQTDINCMVDGYIFHDAILRGDIVFSFLIVFKYFL